MWKAIAKSLNEVTASIENATCAVFRGCKRCDIHFHGQSLHNLVEERDEVFVKNWESDEWKVLHIKDGRTMWSTWKLVERRGWCKSVQQLDTRL